MENKNILIFSTAIVIMSIIIAGGILVSRGTKTVEAPTTKSLETIKIQSITNNDHILGNPNADIILVEYADLDCAYCHEFHITMKRIMEDYGKKGRIAWVYRHFPLQSLVNGIDDIQENIPAIASECVASLSGEESFWDFVDNIMLNSEIPVTEEFLKQSALELGVDEDKYNICINSDKFNTKIERDIQDGLSIFKIDPDFGTPYNLIITKEGIQSEISGSQPYSAIEDIINNFSLPTEVKLN